MEVVQVTDTRCSGSDMSEEAIAGAFRTLAVNGADLRLPIYRLGAGKVILNTLFERRLEAIRD